MSEPAFSPPDLTTSEARRAYRRELRRVARPFAATGFALCVAGVAAFFSPIVTGWWRVAGLGAADTGMLIAVAGWLLLIAAFFRRNKYHRRRMRGEIPGPA